MASRKEMRKLGLLEQYSSSRHSLGLYSCIIDTCEYAIPKALLQSNSLETAVQLALKDVIAKLPSLSAGIQDERSKKPKFVHLASLKVSNHLTWRRYSSQGDTGDSSTLISILEQEHSMGFDNIEMQPPWRVICIEYIPNPPSDDPCRLSISFAVHHALADGVSAALFHSYLLEALNAQTTTGSFDGDLDMVFTSNELTLPSPLEDRLKFPISWSFLLKTLWMILGPNWLTGAQNQSLWTGKPINPEPKQNHIRLIQIDSRSLTKILQVCRMNKTTLTPLLHAIVLASMVRHSPTEETATFAGQTPINLRPFLNDRKDGHNAFGVYLTGGDHQFDVTVIKKLQACIQNGTWSNECLPAIWNVASQVTADLGEKRSQIPNDDGIGLLSYIGDFHDHWQKMYGSPRDVTWEVSNIGSLPVESRDDDGGWKITRSIFTQPGNAVGSAFSVNVAGVSGAGVCMSLCWQDGILSEQLMDKLADEIDSLLGRIASS